MAATNVRAGPQIFEFTIYWPKLRADCFGRDGKDSTGSGGLLPVTGEWRPVIFQRDMKDCETMREKGMRTARRDTKDCETCPALSCSPHTFLQHTSDCKTVREKGMILKDCKTMREKGMEQDTFSGSIALLASHGLGSWSVLHVRVV